MILREEIYFDITFEGAKSVLSKIESFLLSGAFDDYFEISREHITYDEDLAAAGTCRMILSNEDYGIEMERFNPEKFLAILCPNAKDATVTGSFYDIDDEEYRFVSLEGDDGHSDADNINLFNDELSEKAYEEYKFSDDDEEEF